MSILAERGILYLSFGEKYKHETQRSLQSVKNVCNIKTAVVTDKAWADDPKPDHFIFRDSVKTFRCKPLYIYEASPFELTLFLDTDTVLARDITPIFGMLNYYDIGVRFGGAQLREREGLEFHAQCNSGVILFRKCDETARVCEEWLKLYDDALASEGRQIEDSRNLNDQRYLAIAIARSRARPVHLAEYLNFALFENLVTCSPPAIYHGRNSWIEGLAQQITSTWKMDTDWFARVWLPNLAGFLPQGVSRSDPLLATAFVFRRLFNEIRWRMKKPHNGGSGDL